jgi:hypothetical protein
MVSTTDNSHFSRTFGSSNDIPAGVDNGHSGLWYEALQNTGVWIDRKVGGYQRSLYNLHVIGDVDAGDKISTNLPIETTSYVRAQTILTESDSRVKEKVVTIDPYTSETSYLNYVHVRIHNWLVKTHRRIYRTRSKRSCSIGCHCETVSRSWYRRFPLSRSNAADITFSRYRPKAHRQSQSSRKPCIVSIRLS